MKRKKLILILSVILVVLIGGAVGGYFYFSQTKDSLDTTYLTMFDAEEGHYYLKKAPADISFEIKADDSDVDEYTIIDENDEEVKTSTKSLFGETHRILPPEGGYVPGGYYTLTLPDKVTFLDENLKAARILSFSIEKEAVARYEFTENVTETDATLSLKDENTLYLNDVNAQVGDILFGTDENDEYVIYKITELHDDGTAEVVLPAVDEVYDELEVYGEAEWDVEQIVENPDLNFEIAENVRNSEFFDRLILQAYADEVAIPSNIGISVESEANPADNSLSLTIEISLEPGKNGLFGVKKLNKQKVTVTLNPTLQFKSNYDIKNPRNWDISASVMTSFTWKIDLSMYTNELEEDDLAEFFSKNPATKGLAAPFKTAKSISEKMSKLANDVISGEIKIFDWKLPIPNVPGLYFSAEVKLFAELEIAADLTISQTISTTYTAGIRLTKGEFDVYSNNSSYNSGLDLTLQGKASFKAGLKLIIKATLVHDEFANINIDPQFGLYTDLFITIPVAGINDMNNKRTFAGCYFEPGCYFSANFNAHINLGKDIDFSHTLVEIKKPFDKLTFGDSEIPIRLRRKVEGIQFVGNLAASQNAIKASAGMITLPDFELEYYDVTEGYSTVRDVPFEDLHFYTSSGEALSTVSRTIPVPPSFGDGNNNLTVQYKQDDRIYQTSVPVQVPTSKLIGMVSAYNNGEETPLQWAKVQIFTEADTTKAIRTTFTDADGRFTLAVQPGNYKILVSAVKYLPLESWQRIGEDETKYTEHVLLIEEPEEPEDTGTASGTLTNAINGQGISDATIRIREDWNNTEGDYFGDYETITDYDGNYTIEDVPNGYYTVEASQDGFVAGHSNIIVMDDTDAKDDFDFTITPELDENEIRIVLSWGYSPSDLDSHIIGYTPSSDTFHVYYSDKYYDYQGMEMLNLDVDDTSSYGPETITILRDIHDTYTYYVHDYSNGGRSSSDALSYSDAVVRVFKGSSMIAEYYVPTGYTGTYWNVFQIDATGRITPINTISNTCPSLDY